MTRAELMKQLAEIATRPLIDDAHQAAVAEAPPPAVRELFVWFEDTSARAIDGRRGIAGLPESLLPLAVGLVADGDCDLGLIGYEISSLAERFGPLLTPALITESRQHLPR